MQITKQANRRIALPMALLLSVSVLAACSSDDDETSDTMDPGLMTMPDPDPYVAPDGTVNNLIDAALADPDNFSALAARLETAQLNTLLSDAASVITVFAPTNAAFAAYEEANPGVLDALSQEDLASLLQFHMIAGSALDTAAVTAAAGTSLTTASSAALPVMLDGETIRVGGAALGAATFATNGIIHAIDAVLTPPVVTEPDPGMDPDPGPTTGDYGNTVMAMIAAQGNLGSFTQALQNNNTLDLTLAGNGTFTVFAPTDAAFAAMGTPPADLGPTLLFHITTEALAGTDLTDGLSIAMTNGASTTIASDGTVISINGANISMTDIAGSNGTVHVIDAVLTP